VAALRPKEKGPSCRAKFEQYTAPYRLGRF
jgi:hypothetical protein